MKDQSIEKINTIGKISYIAAIFAKCMVIVGLVVTLLMAILCFTVFAGKFKADVSGKIDVELDCKELEIDYEALETLDDEDMQIKSETITIGDSNFGKILSFEISDQDYKAGNVEIKDDILTAQLESEGVTITAKEAGCMLLLVSLGFVMTIVTISFVEALCKEFRNCETPFDAKVIKKMQNLAISLIPWTIVSSVSDSVMASFLQGGLQFQFNLDLSVALVVLIVFILVYIFKYGAILQQESDETL